MFVDEVVASWKQTDGGEFYFFFPSRKIQKFKNTKKRENRGPRAQRAKEPFLNLDAAGALRWTTPFRMGRMILEMTAAAAVGKAVIPASREILAGYGGVVLLYF